MACEVICPLLAGVDSLYFSCDLLLSAAMREKLATEKATAQALGKQVHCPEWLGAWGCPQGDKGGYAFLVETRDFSVKLLGEPIPHQPGVFIEMHSLALHTHSTGAPGACEAALAWVRDHLFAGQYAAALQAITFTAAKPNRVDLHIDYQGGIQQLLTDHFAKVYKVRIAA
jgi:hypothetical protein